MGNKIIALEYEADRVVSVGIPIRCFKGFCRLSVDDKVAVGILIKSTDDIKHRGLTAARGTEDRHEFAFSEFKINTLKGVNLEVSRVIILFYVDEL